MSNAILEVFDASLQKTQLWFNDLMAELNWENHPQRAYLALRTVLHALRDRLTVEEALQLSAQLPMLIRGFYLEGWNLKGKPHKDHKEEFLGHIANAFKNDITVKPERIARAVFKVLAKHVSNGEIEDIRHILPRDLQDLWPEENDGEDVQLA